MSDFKKTAILINVGTPDASDPESVGRYLNQFLMDPYIISIPRPFRDILVKLIIVPKRKFSSSEKYQSIWKNEGSPLMIESKSLQAELQKSLGSDWQVRLGMQIGNPSLKSVIEASLKDSSEIHYIPLYPQFAMATTGGAVELIRKMMPKGFPSYIHEPFYEKPWFVKSQAQAIRTNLQAGDHLLLSYHGLPVSQLKSHRSSCESNGTCCEMKSACQENCYKAQCLATSKLLKKELAIENLSIGFQSRLGRARWIEPSTQSVAQDLAHRGVKKLKVACPSFVADFLLNLE